MAASAYATINLAAFRLCLILKSFPSQLPYSLGNVFVCVLCGLGVMFCVLVFKKIIFFEKGSHYTVQTNFKSGIPLPGAPKY